MIRWTSLTAFVAAGALAACDRPSGPVGPADALDDRSTFAVVDAAAPVADALSRVVPALGESAVSTLGPALGALETAVEHADLPAVQRASIAAEMAIAKYDAATSGQNAADVEAIRLAVAAVRTTN